MQHQQGQHHHDEQRYAGVHRLLSARGVFHRATDFQQVTVRQFGTHRIQGWQDLLDQRHRLFLAIDISADGNVRQAVAVPDDALLETVLKRCHLRQRHALAVVGRHRQAWQVGKLGSFLAGAAQEDLDQFVVFAELAD
ncbi:hypothetical protein D9M71_503670 [compost metagenome]